MDDIFKQKAEERKRRAKLPFEEKIKTVVRLQRRHAEIAKAAGRKPPRVWDIDI